MKNIFTRRLPLLVINSERKDDPVANKIMKKKLSALTKEKLIEIDKEKLEDNLKNNNQK